MYDWKAEVSTWGILVRVTGGLSFVDGGFGVPGPVVCGRSPVRTIGGCNKVEIAEFHTISTCLRCIIDIADHYHCFPLLNCSHPDSTGPRYRQLM